MSVLTTAANVVAVFDIPELPTDIHILAKHSNNVTKLKAPPKRGFFPKVPAGVEPRVFAWAQAAIAVAYTPKSTGNFRVQKPKLVLWDKCDDFDMGATIESFFTALHHMSKARRSGTMRWMRACRYR